MKSTFFFTSKLDVKDYNAEKKLEEVAASKVKLDIELLGLNTDETVRKKLDDDYEETASSVKNKISDLKAANDERGLFALNKEVKDAAAYPETFHGKAGENIYIFLDKMKEALSSNQVTEKNRADVFKKHLGGAARNLIDNSQ